ncbi:MAG: 2,3,4,5-tetrahydropyridine-2,6-dicarboxylate N-succinyltransferase, partial [Deltaproteobacteria bacterium]|nr:2,3,4,5-tetrahydropyridine-2,6-dicarboxylate N-succinyltransferase [Deltaproteobacteria bacterium]
MKIDHPYYFAVGIGTKNRRNQWLEVYYPEPLSLKRPETIKAIRDKFVDKAVKDTVGITIELNPDETGEIEALFLDDPEQNRIRELIHQIKSSKHPLVLCLIDPRSDPAQVPDIYLRLHLLSHRLVKPHEINLNGIFGKLHNIAWTNRGAVDLSELRELQLEVRLKGEYLSVNSVDKFPKMTDYVVPAGVRIADTARVRLGAYIGEGTTIMHE